MRSLRQAEFDALVHQATVQVLPHAMMAAAVLADFIDENFHTVMEMGSPDEDKKARAKDLYQNLSGALEWEPLSFIKKEVEDLGVTSNYTAIYEYYVANFPEDQVEITDPVSGLVAIVMHQTQSVEDWIGFKYGFGERNMRVLKLAQFIGELGAGGSEIDALTKRLESSKAAADRDLQARAVQRQKLSGLTI